MHLKHFKQIDPLIYDILKSVDLEEWFGEWVTPGKTSYFKALCRDIIAQQLSTKAARTIVGRFLDLFEDQFPTPSDVLKLEDQKLRDVGLSWSKVKYVKDLASKSENNEIKLDTIHELSDSEVIEELIKVKGIGNWTAEMFLMFTLRRPDVFSIGDLGLKKGFAKVYNKKKPSEKYILRTVKKWTPFRSFGAIALWHALDNV